MQKRTDPQRLESTAIVGAEVLRGIEDRVGDLHTELRRTREELEALRDELALARRSTLRTA